MISFAIGAHAMKGPYRTFIGQKRTSKRTRQETSEEFISLEIWLADISEAIRFVMNLSPNNCSEKDLSFFVRSASVRCLLPM